MHRAGLALVRLMVVAILLPAVAAAKTVRVQFAVQVKSAANQGGCESPEDPALSDQFAPPGRLIAGEFSYASDVVGTEQREGPGAGMLTFKLDPSKADFRLSIGPGSIPVSALAHISPRWPTTVTASVGSLSTSSGGRTWLPSGLQGSKLSGSRCNSPRRTTGKPRVCPRRFRSMGSSARGSE